MRARRDPREDEIVEQHDRWMISYADFVTLLFAFFVVMYALSTISQQGQYQVLSTAIESAFNRDVPPAPADAGAADKTDLLPAAQPSVLTPSNVLPYLPENVSAEDVMEALDEQKQRQAMERHRKALSAGLRQALAPLAKNGLVTVTEGDHGISIEINAKLLFASSEAALNPMAAMPLRTVGSILASTRFKIAVEGHTDNRPIRSWRYPSNWELSSARASSVVRLFIESGVRPDLLTASGFSDQRPIDSNDTEAGRANNRRVTIQIETDHIEPLPTTPTQLEQHDPLRSVLPAAPAPAPAPATENTQRAPATAP